MKSSKIKFHNLKISRIFQLPYFFSGKLGRDVRLVLE